MLRPGFGGTGNLSHILIAILGLQLGTVVGRIHPDPGIVSTQSMFSLSMMTVQGPTFEVQQG